MSSLQMVHKGELFCNLSEKTRGRDPNALAGKIYGPDGKETTKQSNGFLNLSLFSLHKSIPGLFTELF